MLNKNKKLYLQQLIIKKHEKVTILQSHYV
jgi:hypothetical protein